MFKIFGVDFLKIKNRDGPLGLESDHNYDMHPGDFDIVFSSLQSTILILGKNNTV